MNVLLEAYDEIVARADSLRADEQADGAEIERLDLLVTLFGHALVSLGLLQAPK